MSNLELAFKITADNKGARPALTQSTTDLQQLDTAATSAATGLNTASISIDKAGKESMASAASGRALVSHFKQLTPAVDSATAAQLRLRRAANDYNMTVGQYQQAQRQLPMQITDVVTSLAGGMPVYMVAIQQGGQLRDSFGGIGKASRALVGSLASGLAAINPLTLAIAATVGVAGALGVAFYQGYRETQEYNRALISTGNYAGTTTGALASLTDQVGDATNEFGDARAAVNELASSGKLSGEALEDAALAAVNLARLTGATIEETTADIIKLADAPSKNLAALNERYHFLTLATYEQIRALENQDQEQKAIALGVGELSRVMAQRTQEMEGQAGSLERAWKSVGDTVSDVWQSMKNLGRDDNEYLLAQARERLANVESTTGVGRPAAQRAAERIREEIRALEGKITATRAAAEATAQQLRDDEAGIKASQEREKAEEETRKKAERAREASVRSRIADADRLRKAADTEVATMQRQIALGEKATQVAKTRYEIEYGAYSSLDSVRQAALMKEAARLDAYEAANKSTEEYKSLLEDLQTKEEKLTSQMFSRLSVLDAMRARGAVNDADYNSAASRTVGAGYEEAPKVGQIKDGDEKSALAAQQAWLSKQMAQLAQDRAQRADLNAQWDAKEIELKRQHQLALDEINRQSSTNYDAMWSQSFDRFASGVGQATASAIFQSESLSDGLRNVVLAMGQQVIATLVEISVKRVALAVLDKAAATTAAAGYVASITSQSAAQTAMAGLNAFASTAAIPVVGPIAAPAAAAAATAAAGTMGAAAVAAASTGVIAGMAHDGISRVPAANEGTWLLKQDEMVLNPAQADSFGTLLNFVRNQQQAAQGGGSTSSGGASKVTVILRNEGGEALETKLVSQKRVGDEERVEIALMTKQMIAQDLIQRGDLAQVQEGVYAGSLRRSGR